MHKLISQPAPSFVQAIKNGLVYWLSVTNSLDADSIKKLDPKKDNLFQILDYGLQLPEVWELTAALMVQVFPLPDRRGYWNLWLEKLSLVIVNRPEPVTPTLVRLQINYGKLLRSLGQRKEAVSTHFTAVQYAQYLSDDILLAHVFMELGWDYLLQNDLDNAQLFAEKALKVYESVQDISDVQLVDTLRVLGTVETNRGNVAQAVKYFKQALHHAQAIRTPIVLARSYISLGLAYRSKKKFTEALDCYGRAAGVLVNSIYESDKINVFLNIGAIYFDQEMWDAAEAEFRRVNNRYLRESGDLKLQAILWNNQGNVYWKQGRLEEAEKSLQDAMTIWPQIGNEIELANTLATLVEVYILQERKAEAELLIEEAMEKVKRYSNHAWANEIKDELENLQKRIEGD